MTITNPQDPETLFIQSVIQLADKYNVRAIIDWENKNIDFQGDCDEVALAQELEDLFGQYVI
jgi:hypothetical protein